MCTMARSSRKRHASESCYGEPVARRRRSRRRIVLIGLGIGVAALVLLAPRFMNVSDAARNAKAQADTHALANAVKVYRTHMQRLPSSLEDLTQPARNGRGETLDPLLHVVPLAPSGYTPYRYERRADGSYSVSTAGNGKGRIK